MENDTQGKIDDLLSLELNGISNILIVCYFLIMSTIFFIHELKKFAFFRENEVCVKCVSTHHVTRTGT